MAKLNKTPLTIRAKRGTEAEITSYTGYQLSGEIAYATDTEAFFVSNGTTFVPVGGSSETPTLQSVTDAGNTTTNAISAGTVTANNELHLVNSEMRIFRSSDDMRIRTGNSDRMTITSTGNVGIGVTAPTAKLEIGSDNGWTELLFSRPSGGSHTANITSTSRMQLETTNDELILRTRNQVGNGISILPNYNIATTSGTIRLGSSTKTNPDKIYIYGDMLASGKVGIGTTSPANKLHVNAGNVNQVATFESTDAAAHITLKDNAGALYLNRGTGQSSIGSVIGDSTSNITIKDTGEVGIGTESPAAKLHVATSTSGGTASAIIQDDVRTGTGALNYIGLTDSAGTTQAKIGYLSTLNGDLSFSNLIGSTTVSSTGQVTLDASSNIRLNTNGSTGVKIDNTGNVGIGTTSPTSKTHINGTAMSQLRLEQQGGPATNTDTKGQVGDIAYDDQYFYVKTTNGWGRVLLDFGF